MTVQTDAEYRMRVGAMVIGMEFQSAIHADQIANYFGVKSAEENPHVRLKINIVPHNDVPIIPDSLFKGKNFDSEGFSIGQDLVRGRFRPDKSEVELWIKNILFQGSFIRVFEQLLYQAFYLAGKTAHYDAFLIHSAGIIRRNEGFLFVGPAGAGKTTLAQLSLPDCVLNDEICLISFNKGGIILSATPFNGFFREKTDRKARLRAVFTISHGKEHQLIKISKAKAAASIFHQIVPPIGLDEALSHDSLVSMLDLATRLTDKTPVQHLEFRPDSDFWEKIDHNNFNKRK